MHACIHCILCVTIKMSWIFNCIFFTAIMYDAVRCCGKIPHGEVESNCLRYCHYSCEPGYEPAMALPQLDCSDFGTWSPSYGRWRSESDLCKAKLCPDITVPNGRLSACLRTVERPCRYSCEAGYTQRSTHVACLPSQKWEHDPHSLCTKATQCPFEVENGDLDLSCNRNPSEACTYTCHEGSLPDSTRKTVKCGENATWDKPLDSICTIVECSTTISHGMMYHTCNRGYNDKCSSYTCDTGYEKPPVQPSYFQCNATAQWEIQWYSKIDGAEPCLETSKLCPPIIDNGRISGGCLRLPGAECEYFCNRYCLQDTRVQRLTCQSNLQWEPASLRHVCWNCFTTTPYPFCPSSTGHAVMKNRCRGLPGDRCAFTCSFGCHPTVETLLCDSTRRWQNGENACYCGELTTAAAVSTESELNVGLIVGLTVAGIAILVFFTVFCFAYRHQHPGTPQQNPTATPRPVIYHQVSTEVQPSDTGGEGHNNRYYYSPSSPGDPNLQPPLPGTRATPSAPEWGMDNNGPATVTGVAPSATNNAEATPTDSVTDQPPPSYTEVMTDPVKYKT